MNFLKYLVPKFIFFIVLSSFSCGIKVYDNGKLSSLKNSNDEKQDNKINNDIITKLGAVYTKNKTTFAIWSPDTDDVKLFTNAKMYSLTQAKNVGPYSDINDGNIYSVTVEGDLHLKEYQFFIAGKAVRDPYGIMIKSGTDTNIVIDLSTTNLTEKLSEIPLLNNREDASIYELSVRDFTISETSGVSANKRGKFLGLVEAGTKYHSVKTGLDHLKELGISHVQLLPVYDFDYDGNNYNWGYNPVNYNIPEESFSNQNVNDYVGRIQEFKKLVNEFHKNNLRVVIDVVYNHTHKMDMFDKITKRYYTGNNDSGCGNGINTAEPFVSRMIRDSLEFWVNTYNVDGFRFDLLGVFHHEAVKNWGDYLNNAKYAERNLLMYGEPWNGYYGDNNSGAKVRMGKMPTLANSHIGIFNGKYREAIKGNNDGKSRGYMFNVLPEWNYAIASGSRGSIMANKSTNPLTDEWDSMFAYDPEQSINYLSAHDNFDLWDKIKYSGEDNEYGRRINKFAMGMIFTSQGIPFIHSGEEFLRSKVVDGDWSAAHNSYNSSDKYNMIRWDNKENYLYMFNYYKDLVSVRKKLPGLRLTSWDEINTKVQTTLWNNGTIISQIDTDNNSATKELIVVFNSANKATINEAFGAKKIFDINGFNVTDNFNTVEGTAVTIFTK